MSISMRRIHVLFMMKLQMILKNLSIMIGPIMAIVIVYIFKLVMPISTPEEMEAEHMAYMSGYILQIGVIFNITMTGIMAASMPLAEEKEKHTLRVLMTSSVSGAEFLIGSLAPVLAIMAAINLIMVPISGVRVENILIYLVITTLASGITIILGLLIGIMAKNQMSASLLSMPFMFILMMIPLVSQLNEFLRKIAGFIYTGTLNEIISKLAQNDPISVSLKNILVLIIWFVLATGSFFYFYKKNGLESD